MPERRQRARELRASMTDAEVILWSQLQRGQAGGFRFRRQYPAGPYFLDFYCPAKRLAVELDGGQHAGETAKGYDEERTRYLQAKHIRVIRFWNRDVLTNLDNVLETIRNELG